MVAGDLPPGKWTPSLIGPWWPGPSAGLGEAASHWGAQSKGQEKYGTDLKTQADRLTRNQGATADDLVERFLNGRTFHYKLARKYKEKEDAFKSGQQAIDTLRETLSGIARDYGKQIEQIESSQTNAVMKLARIAGLITEANGKAATASITAVSTITDAVQKILTAEGITTSAQDFLNSQGINTTPPKAPDANEAASKGLGMDELGDKGNSGAHPGDSSGLGNNGQTGGGTGLEQGLPGQGTGGLGDQGHSGGPIVGGPIGGSVPGSGGRVPSGVGGAPSLPGAGQLNPAAALGKGLSPESLGKSFSSGVASGQPLAAGANSLSSGTMNAVENASGPQQAQTMPAAPAAAPASMMSAPHVQAVDSAPVEHGSSGGGSAAVASAAPVAPVAPVVAGPVAAPAAMGPAAPAAPVGPLPAYGSDIRPPVVSAPPVAGPVGPVAGTPVAASPASSPSAGAGAPVVSAVDRAGAGGVGGQNASASGVAGAAMAAGMTGAAAGAAGEHAAKKQRLQRLVDAVARQAPKLSWAAGERDDGSTLLVTDFASGWIPPNVRIPAGVDRVLAPSRRRSDVGVVDLLGSVMVAAAHERHGFISEAGSDEPALTADLRVRKVEPIDEVGPKLADIINRGDFPSTVKLAGRTVSRQYKLEGNELEGFRQQMVIIQQEVLAGRRSVSDWMLCAAIDALNEGHRELGQYHLAWQLVMAA